MGVLCEKVGFNGQAVAVEVNKQLVPKKRHAETALKPDDRVEIVTLVVTGERDCLVGEATRAELDTIANSAIEVVVVPGAGHYVRQDQTDAFHAVVDPWLAERLHRGGGD